MNESRSRSGSRSAFEDGTGRDGHGVVTAQEVAGDAAVPSPRTSSDGAQVEGGRAARRDQYIDGLRALALVRVLAFHTFGWIFLPVIFPSMGVMFSLGGALVATSLSRAQGNHWVVLRKRVRRLLPPLWLYGAVLVALMVYNGWTVTATAGTPLTWRSALAWFVPLEPVPGSAWGDHLVLPLWYVRTYLWLVLLSPMALWLFRRYPRVTLSIPGLTLLLILGGVVDADTTIGDTIQNLAMFGTCWLLGFAHHDGHLKRLPRASTVAWGLLAMALGLGYALWRPDPDAGWSIDDIPLADMLYSTGAVLVLLRLYPEHTVLERLPWLSKLVSAVNARAMTIYLWGNLAIVASTPLIESTAWTTRLESGPLHGRLAQFVVAIAVLVVVVLAAGWAEDVAAGRPARLNPWPREGRPRGNRPRAARRLTGMVAVAGLLGVSLGVAFAVGPRTDPSVAAAGPTDRTATLPVAGAQTSASAAGLGLLDRAAGDAPAAGRRTYPVHSDVLAMQFRVGTVVSKQDGDDGQSVSSAWDAHWAQHYGGCDGLGPVGAACTPDTGARRGPDWFPTTTVPRENPYYVALPFDDLAPNGTTGRERMAWAQDPGFVGRQDDRTVSFLKNRWVSVTGPAATCFAQVEDTGPGAADPAYVFDGAAPSAHYGMHLSPALFRCLGFDGTSLDGRVSWSFVDAPDQGPWARLVTTRQVG